MCALPAFTATHAYLECVDSLASLVQVISEEHGCWGWSVRVSRPPCGLWYHTCLLSQRLGDLIGLGLDDLWQSLTPLDPDFMHLVYLFISLQYFSLSYT